MRAAVWHGTRDVRVDTVPDPTIEEPTDAVVRITTTGLCGSDLHLYEVRRWVDDILPLVTDDADPLGTEDFASHRLPLDEAPTACANFQAKKDGAIKILFKP